MNIKTLSFIPQLESALNKPMQAVTAEDLHKIKSVFHNVTQLDGTTFPLHSSDLALFENLEILGLANCFLNEEDIEIIAKLKHLKGLSLYACTVTADCEVLTNLKELERLDITNTKLESLNFISNFKNLKTVQTDEDSYENNINFFNQLKEVSGVRIMTHTEDEGD